ncbi:MAG: hypothetical protein P4L40_02570 [Terracidiphilus sp.]|nr:hypothetical protein [Terracidiphilus sp.]
MHVCFPIPGESFSTISMDGDVVIAEYEGDEFDNIAAGQPSVGDAAPADSLFDADSPFPDDVGASVLEGEELEADETRCVCVCVWLACVYSCLYGFVLRGHFFVEI